MTLPNVPSRTDESGNAGELAARVLAMGREGLSRAEIAAALGMSLAALGAREVSEAPLRAAMVRAETEAKAWWEALPRGAMEIGATFKAAAWRAAVAERFGEDFVQGRAAPASATGEPGEEELIVRFNIPDNGRRRKKRNQR